MKRIYFQPEVTVARVATMNLMLGASPATNTMSTHTEITDDQW